jgi:hypothetical protein
VECQVEMSLVYSSERGGGGAHAHFFAFFGLPTELSVVVGARKGGPIGKE